MSLAEIAVPLNYGRAIERWPDAQSLSDYYKAITSASNGLNHGLVEHVRSFVESVCVTVLSELDEEIPTGKPTTTQLLVAALKACGVHNTRDATSLSKFLTAFNTMADALSEMRNWHGPVAHGKDGFVDAICTNHARSFLFVGDTLIGVLLAALEGTEPDLIATREPYSRFGHLAKKVDQVVSMKAKVESDEAGPILVVSMNVAGKKEEVVNMRLVPSQILFGLDRQAFVEVLKEVPPDLVVIDEGGELEAPPIEKMEPVEEEAELLVSSEPEPEVVKLRKLPPPLPIEDFTGRLGSLSPGITAILASFGLESDALVESLIEAVEQSVDVDWEHRESLQARLRLALRRVLILHDFEVARSGPIAEQLVAWLRTQPEATGIEQPGFEEEE